MKPTNWEIFWAGCAGGAAQLVVACPVDVVKIKLQTQTGEFFVKSRYIHCEVWSGFQFLVKPIFTFFVNSVSLCSRNFQNVKLRLDFVEI